MKITCRVSISNVKAGSTAHYFKNSQIKKYNGKFFGSCTLRRSQLAYLTLMSCPCPFESHELCTAASLHCFSEQTRANVRGVPRCYLVCPYLVGKKSYCFTLLFFRGRKKEYSYCFSNIFSIQKERENLIASHWYFLDAKERDNPIASVIFSRYRKKEKILLLHIDIFVMQKEKILLLHNDIFSMQKERKNLTALLWYFLDAERKRWSYCFTVILSQCGKKEKHIFASLWLSTEF